MLRQHAEESYCHEAFLPFYALLHSVKERADTPASLPGVELDIRIIRSLPLKIFNYNEGGLVYPIMKDNIPASNLFVNIYCTFNKDQNSIL